MTLGLIPWGRVAWLLDRLSWPDCTIVGAIAPEERCTACYLDIAASGRPQTEFFFSIHDPVEMVDTSAGELREQHVMVLSSAKGGDLLVHDSLLLVDDDYIYDAAGQVSQLGERVFLDVSCMPKRYFFPLIRVLLEAGDVRDLVIGYAEPDAYGTGDLIGDPITGAPLPGFGASYPDRDSQLLVIGAGFQTPGFENLLDVYQSPGMRSVVLIPFPADAPRHNRIWQFSRSLEVSIPSDDIEYMAVPVHDLGLMYLKLSQLLDNGRRPATLLPYGPKPMSVAMCLACLSIDPVDRPEVIYAQPRWYSPTYSTGIRRVGGESVTHCWPLKIAGRPTYGHIA